MNVISRLRHALFGDPIRIAPDEGRLLRLQVGQRIVLDDALLVVTARDESRRVGEAGVRYRLVELLREPDKPVPHACLPDAPYLLDSRRLACECDAKLERDCEGACIWLDCRVPRESEV